MGDEVQRYKSVLNTILDKWQEQTEKELAKDLAPIIKAMEELGKKDPGHKDKAQWEKLLVECQRTIDGRLGHSVTTCNATVKKLKRPQQSDDDKGDDYKDLWDDYKKIKIPDPIKKNMPFKDIDIGINSDDKGGVIWKGWRF